MKLSRRSFIKTTAVAAAGVSIFGCGSETTEKKVNVNTQSGIIMPKTTKRIVVLGGGFGGLTSAKYVKLIDPSIEVIVIEQLDKYTSCPISNLVIGGLKKMEDITFSYDNLQRNYGIKFVNAKAVTMNPDAKYIETEKGRIEYDRAIISPGIDFKFDLIEGYDSAAQEKFVHAWKAGPMTAQLAGQMAKLTPGKNVIVAIPGPPYRCPPGPYERISLMANFIKKHKPGSKVIVMDTNEKITSKGALFSLAWKDYYSDIIEYHPEMPLTKVDAGAGQFFSGTNMFEAEVANIIPNMKAGKFAFDSGLVEEGKDWAGVKAFTMESLVHKDVHVVGDSTHTGTVGPVPKSGAIANSMGKTAAAAAVAIMNGYEPVAPAFSNSCYSMVNDTEAIWVAAVYHYDKDADRIMGKSSGLSPARSENFGKQAEDWAKGIWSDILL